MPKVISTGEFRQRMGTYIKGLLKAKDGDSDYLIVANETYPDRSFVVSMIAEYADICEAAFLSHRAVNVKEILKEVKQATSERNRRNKLGL